MRPVWPRRSWVSLCHLNVGWNREEAIWRYAFSWAIVSTVSKKFQSQRPAHTMWLLTRLLLALFVHLPLCLVLLALGAVAGATLAARAADRRATAKWRTNAVQRLTDASASDVRRILGELPPWVADSAFQKVRRKCDAKTAPSLHSRSLA